jgi:hypothetical protein
MKFAKELLLERYKCGATIEFVAFYRSTGYATWRFFFRVPFPMKNSSIRPSLQIQELLELVYADKFVDRFRRIIATTHLSFLNAKLHIFVM